MTFRPIPCVYICAKKPSPDLGKATLWDIFGTLNPRAHTQKRVKFRTETAQKINLGHFVRPPRLKTFRNFSHPLCLISIALARILLAT